MRQIDTNGGRKIVNYLKGASPRISIEENNQANHFELIDFIKRYGIVYKEIVDELSKQENEQRVLEMLKKEFYPLFTRDRAEAIDTIIKIRFKTIREATI